MIELERMLKMTSAEIKKQELKVSLFCTNIFRIVHLKVDWFENSKMFPFSKDVLHNSTLNYLLRKLKLGR